MRIMSIGSPAVGKSFLLNQLTGAELSTAESNPPISCGGEKPSPRPGPTGKVLTCHIKDSSKRQGHGGVNAICTNMAGSVVGDYDLPIGARIKDLREAIQCHLQWHVIFLDDDGKDVVETAPLARHTVLTLRLMHREPCYKVGDYREAYPTHHFIDSPGLNDDRTESLENMHLIMKSLSSSNVDCVLFITNTSQRPVITNTSQHPVKKSSTNMDALEQKLCMHAQRLETKRRSLAVKSGNSSGPWSKSVRQSLRMHKQNGHRRC